MHATQVPLALWCAGTASSRELTEATRMGVAEVPLCEGAPMLEAPLVPRPAALDSQLSPAICRGVNVVCGKWSV